MQDLSLDVAAPEDVATILRQAADAYYASASALDSAWQDPGAGEPWTIIARILERTASKIEQKLDR